MEDLNWQDFVDQLTKKMQSSVLSNFEQLSTNLERVKFCINNEFMNDVFNKWMKNKILLNINVKDSELSLQYKANGNQAYARKNDNKALELYNNGLLYATKSEIGLLYGNRSAVLFSQSLWQKCVVDINMALNNGFPDVKAWKLYKRKGESLVKLKQVSEGILSFEKALDLLKTNKNLLGESEKINKMLLSLSSQDETLKSAETIKSDFEPVKGYNLLLSSGSSCLKLCQDSSHGRYLVANDDIEAGSIIISEKPYAAVLLPPWYKTHCQNCFCKVKILFPCYQCTKVCYCSMDCQVKSWESYHYFECGKLDVMEQIGISHLALRIVLVTNKKTLLKFSDLKESPEFPGCDRDGVYQTNYGSVYHLLSHSKDLCVEDLFQYTSAAILLYKLLLNHQYFSISDTDDVKFHIAGLLLRHIQQLVCNGHAITSLHGSTSPLTSNIIEQDQVRIATAIYPTTSLLNHSCEPTILNSFCNDRLIVKVVKPVKKGDQIYNCYGPHYRRMDFNERQLALKQQYFFTCHCDHCKKGSVAMEMDCFSCSSCQHALQTDNICCNCNLLNSVIYIDKCNKKFNEAEEFFKDGLQILQNKESISKALNVFLKCLHMVEKICYKYHSLLAKTYDVVARCYAMLYNYQESLIFIKKSITIVESRYGNKSVEVTNELLKMSDVYMEIVQQYIDQKDIQSIQCILGEAMLLLKRGIMLVELNKGPDCEDLNELQCKYTTLSKLTYL